MPDGPWSDYAQASAPLPQGNAAPWESYGPSATPDPTDYSKDHSAFNSEVQKRFKAGASAGDLEDFAKANGYELRGLANAVAYPDRGAVGVVSQAPTDDTPGVVHMLRGAIGNALGPQISRSAADVAGALGGSGGTAGREVAADADREQFANDHPWLSTGLNIAGSIPVAMARGGAALLGGVTGAMQSDGHDLGGIAADAGMGAAGGLIGNGLVRGIAHVAAPIVPAAVRMLTDAGVNLTPGQTVRNGFGAAGRFLSGLEDRATSLPIVGDMIASGRRDAQQQFASGVAQRALTPVGETLPQGLNGNEATAFTRRAMTRAYSGALGNMQALPDQQLAQDLAQVAQRQTNGTLSGDAAGAYQRSVDSILGPRMTANPTMMDGDTLKTIDSELRKRAAQTQDPALREAYSDTRQAVRSAAVRHSPPEAVDALNNADAAYANYVRLRSASAAAPDGNFSPNQLRTAVRTNDTSIGKGDTASGQALVQDYASAGQQVLPSRTGDSGTAGRAATFNPLAWGLGLAGAPIYAGARRAAPLLTREAGVQAQMAGDLLRRSAAPIAAVAAPYLGPPVAGAGLVAATDTADAGAGFAHHLARLGH